MYVILPELCRSTIQCICIVSHLVNIHYNTYIWDKLSSPVMENFEFVKISWLLKWKRTRKVQNLDANSARSNFIQGSLTCCKHLTIKVRKGHFVTRATFSVSFKGFRILEKGISSWILVRFYRIWSFRNLEITKGRLQKCSLLFIIICN